MKDKKSKTDTEDKKGHERGAETRSSKNASKSAEGKPSMKGSAKSK